MEYESSTSSDCRKSESELSAFRLKAELVSKEYLSVKQNRNIATHLSKRFKRLRSEDET